MTNLAFIMDVQDIIAKGATRIFMTSVEINHDTLMEYLNDRLTFARISENKQLENSLRIAFEMVEDNKGNLYHELVKLTRLRLVQLASSAQKI